jgi:hypothetical protein
MANTKINLNKQSDLSLTSANITSPIGIEKSDLPGLVGDLADLSESISSEEIRAMDKEEKLEIQMKSNKDDSDSSISDLQGVVNANQAASDKAELALSNQIADIISNVDPAALDSLKEVAEAFQAADGDLSAAITAALGTHTSELAFEISDRISGDAATLASAKVYTDALEALHASDKAAADAARVAAKAAADAAIVAAKATSDGEIAADKAAADAAIVAAKATSDGEIAAAKATSDGEIADAKAAADAAIVAAKATSDGEIADAKAAADAAIVAAKATSDGEIADTKDAADAARVAAKVVADAATAALQVDVNQNEADADAAFAAMDLAYKAADAAAKVDSDSSIAALQAEVYANQAASDAAELALSNQIADIISNVDPAALDSLKEVAEAFQAADGDLSAAITAALGTHTSELAFEISDRISGDAATLASAKVYTDALEALHVADKAAADAAIVAAKVASDGEIADAKSAADAAIVAAKVASDGEIADAKSAADAAASAMSTSYKAADSTLAKNLEEEMKRAVNAEAVLTTNLNAEIERAVAAEAVLTTNLNAEIERAEGAESLLDGRILDVLNNTEPGAIDGFNEMVNSFNDNLTQNFGYLYSQKIGGELFDTIGKETFPMLDFYPYDTFMSGSDMVVVNGLIQSEGSDYEFFRNDILGSDYEGSVGIRFGGDALTLVNEGAPVIFYGTPDSISYVDISKPTEGPFNWDEVTSEARFGGREGENDLHLDQERIPSDLAMVDSDTAKTLAADVVPNAEKAEGEGGE